MTDAIRVLVIDDSAEDAALVLRSLRRGGFDVVASQRVDTAHELEEAAHRGPWDVVLCDYSMPALTAARALAIVKAAMPDLPVIVVSGVVGEEAAVDCMLAGADDFVLKDNLARLVPALRRELREAAMRGELRASQAALSQSERLRAIGQMAAGLTHDLRNLLNPLLLHLQLMERASTRGDRDLAHQSAESMKAALRRAVETIERLREFSRQERDGELERVSLEKVAQEAIELAKPRGLGGARFVLESHLVPVPPVSARTGDLVAAVLNLVLNAIEAMGDGGTVIARTGTENGGSFVEIADTGPGMPKEVMDRVFEPFFTTKGKQGTGLGLAMVYACAKRYGGNVSLATAPGRGARFRIWLPQDTH